MAGKTAFESTSASSAELGFAGSYLNGPRAVRGGGVGTGVGSFKFGVARSGSGVGEDVRGMLSLENVVIGERVVWCDEVKKVLGMSGGSVSEEETPVVDMKELKRFRLSVEDNCAKARGRANKMDECLRKLDKYSEAVNTKKQKRSELVSNDRSGAGGYLKMDAQINSVNQRVEDRPKNILLNKRVRTSLAESRADCQSNGLPRPHVTMAKDVNLLDANGGESDLFEKMRRLAAGGEGWDNKVKRKRSAGAVSLRPVDSDVAPKRSLQKKVVERGSLPRDAHVFRLNNPDDSPSNRKLPMPPSGSSSPPMAQWAGQRPQKMARARRANLASPLSIQEEKLLSFENGSAPDMGARLISNGINGSPIYKKGADGPQKLIDKADNVQSSPRLSESEEPVSGESRLMAKEIVNSEIGAIAKNKSFISAATPRPVQRSKTGSKKNGNKLGRRLKKLSERKGFSHHPPLQNNSSPDCPGVSNDDREELLAAANHARIASYLACTSAIWKRMEPLFASVSSDDRSFLSQKVGLLNDDFVSGSFSSGEREPLVQHQENESFSRRHDSDKTSNGSIPLYQRLLSSLIVEDDTDTDEEGDARNMHASFNSTYDTARVSECKSFPSNGGLNSFRSSITNNIWEDVHSEGGNSKSFLNGPQMLEAGVADCSPGSQYGEECLDDKILHELQSIGLYPDTLPTLDDEMDNEMVQHEVGELKTRLRQQEVKKKACLEKILKNVESNSGIRDLETLAMDRLVELAYRKLLATRRSARSGVQKVPKHVALAFGRRTLTRCRKFEKSGASCFSEPPYHDILSAPIKNEPDPDTLSDEAVTTNGPILNRGKKKELFLDDIGTAAIRPSSYLGSTSVSSGTKGKRSERDTTKSRKPKAKPKPKQKTGEQPTSGNRVAVNRPTGTTHPTGPTWPSSNVPRQLADDRTEGNGSANLLGDDLDPLDELGVSGPQDLNSFLNFDEQDMDEDFAGGLDIPMDDLTELF